MRYPVSQISLRSTSTPFPSVQDPFLSAMDRLPDSLAGLSLNSQNRVESLYTMIASLCAIWSFFSFLRYYTIKSRTRIFSKSTISLLPPFWFFTFSNKVCYQVKTYRFCTFHLDLIFLFLLGFRFEGSFLKSGRYLRSHTSNFFTSSMIFHFQVQNTVFLLLQIAQFLLFRRMHLVSYR